MTATLPSGCVILGFGISEKSELHGLFCDICHLWDWNSFTFSFFLEIIVKTHNPYVIL